MNPLLSGIPIRIFEDFRQPRKPQNPADVWTSKGYRSQRGNQRMGERRELMNRLTIKVTTNEEDMKVYFNELLKGMVEHDEITGYIILEEKVEE